MSRPFSVEACDFSGWPTRNDHKCSDGRVIRREAFKNNASSMTPLMVKLRKSLSSMVTSVLCPFTPISFSRLALMYCMVAFAK